MAKIEITVPGERIVSEFTALVPQPTTPGTARPPDIGLVEISQSTPTQLIPGPPGAQGPRGSRWYTAAGPPSSTVGYLLGDQYLDGVTGLVWTFDGTAWVQTATDLTGPQGSPDTAAQVLAKLITVDGAGSGLDADLLDAQTGTYYSAWGNLTGKPATFPPTLPIAESDVTNLVTDLAAKAPLASPALTGNPTAPTAAPGDNDTSIATTAFVGAAVTTAVTGLAPLANPTFTGDPKAPTPATGDNDTSIATTAFVKAQAYAPLASPVFTGDPQAPTPAAADNDTSIATTAFVKTAVAAIPGATAQTRNRIVNPAMQISQENANTAGTTVSYFPADQWLVTFVTTGAVSVQRVQSVTPNGSQNRLRLTVTTADTSIAGTEYCFLRQLIEGIRISDFRYGLASARQAVLRFGFKGPAGTYSAHLRNADQTRSWLATFTISAGQANTDTEQVLVIPGDVTGTWLTDTGRGFDLAIVIASGIVGAAGWQAGNFIGVTGMTNGLATVNNIFELFDVGLYLDPANTGLPPPWQMPDEAQELAACMRYWQQSYLYFSGNGTSAVNYYATCSLPVVPRASPVLSGTNAGANNFPATVGTLAYFAPAVVRELRVASATANGSVFSTVVTASARM